jgi:hypothetical protein
MEFLCRVGVRALIRVLEVKVLHSLIRVFQSIKRKVMLQELIALRVFPLAD